MSNIIQAIWGAINGHKFNTGTYMVIAVFVFKQLGVDNDQATQLATNLMLGIGAAISTIGLIHKFIKAWQEKKAAKQ